MLPTPKPGQGQVEKNFQYVIQCDYNYFKCSFKVHFHFEVYGFNFIYDTMKRPILSIVFLHI